MSRDVLKLIEKLGKKEQNITELQFVSPVFYNDTVVTKIDNIVYKLRIPKTAPGWYKIQPIDSLNARIIGEADYADRDQYLSLLGKLQVTFTLKRGNVYLAVPDKNNKYGLPPNELLSVLLFDDSVMDFDRVIVRFDGANFWFETIDRSNDPSKSDYLRSSYQKYLPPENLKFPNLNFGEKLSYALRTTFDKNFYVDKTEVALRKDVEHAGGKLVSFNERSDHFSVTYIVDGEEFTSHVSKDSKHMVIAAGLCLSGNDHRFDLKSLITVVREAQQKDLVHHFDVR